MIAIILLFISKVLILSLFKTRLSSDHTSVIIVVVIIIIMISFKN
jgi:hypothetical protein